MKLHERIDGRLRAFVERQPVFFVATAPLAADEHVNVSRSGVPGTFAPHVVRGRARPRAAGPGLLTRLLWPAG